jgi:hypothetical protein
MHLNSVPGSQIVRLRIFLKQASAGVHPCDQLFAPGTLLKKSAFQLLIKVLTGGHVALCCSVNSEKIDQTFTMTSCLCGYDTSSGSSGSE